MKIILHHLGLGDHLVCNGLVRNLVNQKELFYLVVKNKNLSNIKHMYSDLHNLFFLKVNDDFNAYQLLNSNLSENLVVIGFQINEVLTNAGFGWDEAFYKQMNVDFKKRWSDFYVKREIEKEQKLYKKLNPKHKKYVLIHNKSSDGEDRINYNYIPSNLKKIMVTMSDTIFDYITLIEKAEEIHCVDSSFMHLVESIDTKAKLIYHKNYKLKQPLNHKLIKPWIII